MSPIEVILILFIFFVLTGGIGYISNKIEHSFSRKKLEKEGAQNLKIHDEQVALTCSICSKHVDPHNGDIYYHGQWWCLPHWEESTSIDYVNIEKKEKL